MFIKKLTVTAAPKTNRLVNYVRKSVVNWRSFIILMCFLAICLHAVMRNALNVSSVCMLVRKPKSLVKNATSLAANFSTTVATVVKHRASSEGECQVLNMDTTVATDISIELLYGSIVQCRLTEKEENAYEGNLPWHRYQIDYLLSALGWGRLVAVFPGGYLADRYSSSKILQISMIVASVSTILTPIVAILWGYAATYALRVILGLTMGVFQPCVTALIAQWSPEEELSSRLIFVMSGLQLTVFVLNPILAQYCTFKNFYGGWPIGFLSAGILGFLWCLVWHFEGTNFPEQHPRVSRTELAHIAENRGFQMGDKSEQISLKSYPYRSAFLSKAVLACLISDVAGTFGVYCILYYFPRYLRDVVALDLNTNGFLAGLPNLLMFVCKLVFSFLADFLKKSVGIDKTIVVKAFNTLGLCSLAAFLFGATFIDCRHATLAVLCIVVSKAMYAATGPGYMASELLIAPKYAGTMCGFFNFMAALGQTALPYLMANIVVDSHNVAQWRIVFGIGSSMQILGAVVFLFWGSGEEQEWAKSTSQLSVASGHEARVTNDVVETRMIRDKAPHV